MGSRDRSVGIATGYELDSWGLIPGMGKICLFSTASRPDLGSTQPPIQWVPKALFLKVKRPGCEVDHSPPSSTEVKNAGALPPLFLRLHDKCLIKYKDSFTFYWKWRRGCYAC
jgi:hypothetical protein